MLLPSDELFAIILWRRAWHFFAYGRESLAGLHLFCWQLNLVGSHYERKNKSRFYP